jgi:hypothetical protein
MRLSAEKIQIVLAGACLAFGLAFAFTLFGRGAWLDEFWTLASTPAGQPGGAFWAMMARDVHPALHYGLMQVAQSWGVGEIWGLRALNLIGVPLVLGALWFAHRRGAVNLGQACALIAIYAASPLFLDTVAEIRGYFLLFSAAIATALAGQVLAGQAGRGETWDWRALAAWGGCLFLFVNLHYFALLLGGLLTLALMAMALKFGRRAPSLIGFALVSAGAAAPALILLAAQLSDWNMGIVNWVLTGRVDAVFVMLDHVFAAGARNLPAFGCAIVVLLMAWQDKERRGALLSVLALAGAVAAFFAILVVVNAIRPVVIDRYLIAGGGCAAVLVALLAAGPGAPRWAASAICAFALMTQARMFYSGEFAKPGWTSSARAAAELVSACPGARVFIDPIGETIGPTVLVSARRLGQNYYAEKFGLDVVEIGPGGRVSAAGDCPSIVWLEHFRAPDDMLAGKLLQRLSLEYEGEAELRRSETGTLIMVR